MNIMAAQLDPELRQQMEANPAEAVEAIVVAAGSLEELLASLPDGVVVRHRYRRLRGLAITASANMIRRLAELPTVRSIEADRSLRIV